MGGMRRALRWLFNLAAAVSLLLALAMVALWARSYGRVDRLSGRNVILHSVSGSLVYE